MEIKRKKSKKIGFTLIELLVVIAIIALLASVILVALNNTRAKARDAKRVADINQLGKAFELYFNEKFSYPTSTPSNPLASSAIPGLMVPNYMSKMPATVVPADGTCTAGPGPGTNDYYMYANGATPTTNTYVITFCIGTKVGALSPGAHTLTQAGFQ